MVGENMENKRMTTTKTRLRPIMKGRFVKGEGFNPSYVLTSVGQKLSRVRVIATVANKFVSESGKFASITIDDGSETARVKVFNAVSMFENIDGGDDVDIIAKVKEYQGETYLIPEIIQKISDPNLEILREMELNQQKLNMEKKKKTVLDYKSQVSDVAELTRIMNERFAISTEEVEAILQTEDMEEPKEETADVKNKILGLIESLDKDEGCDYAELLEASGLAEDVIESAVNDLLSEGVCFEPRPGKIKKL